MLKVEDVCRLSEALISDSEGRRRPSRIWTTNMGVLADSTDAGDEGTYASLLIAELSMCTTALRVG